MLKKKWLAVVTAVAVTLVAAPLFNQTVNADSEDEVVQAELFTVEDAIVYAETALDNDDLVFSSDGVRHKNSDGNVFYSLRAQSQDYMDDGGTGTVGFYNVYQNGDVIESKSR